MVSKNSEARMCANTNRASIENNRLGNIDMSIVAKSELNFHGKALIPVSNITGTWLTSSDLAKALEYSNSRAVTMIYNKYADEFTSAMTQVLEVSTTGNYRKKVRVFSLRGAHLIAMFARTDVAKEFRRWVLDLIDREVEAGNTPEPLKKLYTMHLTSNEMCSMAWLYKSAMHMRDELEFIVPKLQALQSPLSYSANSMAINYKRTLEDVRVIMAREVQQIDPAELADNLNWGHVLPDLKIH